MKDSNNWTLSGCFLSDSNTTLWYSSLRLSQHSTWFSATAILSSTLPQISNNTTEVASYKQPHFPLEKVLDKGNKNLSRFENTSKFFDNLHLTDSWPLWGERQMLELCPPQVSTEVPHKPHFASNFSCIVLFMRAENSINEFLEMNKIPNPLHFTKTISNNSKGVILCTILH